jgi:beta-glucanase (GH16 family)
LPSITPSPTIEGPEGMRLIFNEDFHDSVINKEVWNPKLKWGVTNPPELQEYVPEALKSVDGALHIVANPRASGRTKYTSGIIATFDRFYFQFGYVEVRAKVPKGQGLWPALWLLAQSGSAEEIDIMEVLGGTPGTVHTTIHYQQPDGKKVVNGHETQGPDFSEGFHTYAVDWQWDKIIWYIDGNEVFRVSDHVSQEPMYLIANLAVGGDWPGYPDRTTQFPAEFVIDYIRVFSR